MEKQAVFVSVLLLVLMVTPSESSHKICCTQYNEAPVPVRFLKYYTTQKVKESCNIKAVIFTTVKNRRVCANPESEWVQRARLLVPELGSVGRHQKKST